MLGLFRTYQSDLERSHRSSPFFVANHQLSIIMYVLGFFSLAFTRLLLANFHNINFAAFFS